MDRIRRKRSFNMANARQMQRSNPARPTSAKRQQRPAPANRTPSPPDTSNNNPTDVTLDVPVDVSDNILIHAQQPYNTSNDNSFPPAEEEDEAARILRHEAIDMALERITALQYELGIDSGDELTDSDDSDDSEEEPLEHYMDSEIEELDRNMPRFDAKTLGFMACAHETIKYLIDHGVSKDSPMLISLKNRLIEGMNRI